MLKVFGFCLVAVSLIAQSCAFFINPENPRESYPFIVDVRVTRSTGKINNTCSGAIVSVEWILTSCNCLYNANKIEVHLEDGFKFSLNPDKIEFHEQCRPEYKYGDIALINIPDSISLKYNFQTISLPLNCDLNDENITMSIVSSTIYEEADYPFYKFSVPAIGVPKAECEKIYSKLIEDDSIYCVRAKSTLGDGGKILIEPKRNVLLGLFNFSDCDNVYPLVFRRVEDYIAWIAEHIGFEMPKCHKSKQDKDES